MNTKTTLSISEARNKIFEIANEVQKPGVFYALTDRGRPKVVLLSAEEFESWMETLEVIKDFPELKRDLKKAREEYAKGNYSELSNLIDKNDK
ncbi:type II toxin-antitoxin system Phd/YefM family antitoxin [Patescibacteria group bacterium]|nr:type II toxin-antitoxin system Phd/YefM family antitoxin [Patescibacteria group bacterium]